MSKVVTANRLQNGELVQYSYPDFSQEIAAGMEFLDNVAPDWISKIDPQVLDLANTTYCVCGQVFADHYSEGIEKLYEAGLVPTSGWIGEMASSFYGFNVPLTFNTWTALDTAFGERYRDEAAELGEWAKSYTDSESVASSASTNALYSALAEQWIAAIAQRQAGE